MAAARVWSGFALEIQRYFAYVVAEAIRSRALKLRFWIISAVMSALLALLLLVVASLASKPHNLQRKHHGAACCFNCPQIRLQHFICLCLP
jgi:hypothetical protein